MHFLYTHGEHELRKKTSEINVRAHLKLTRHIFVGLLLSVLGNLFSIVS